MSLFKTLASAAILATSSEAADEQILSHLSSSTIDKDTEATRVMHDSLIKLFDLRPIHLDSDTSKTEKQQSG